MYRLQQTTEILHQMNQHHGVEYGDAMTEVARDQSSASSLLRVILGCAWPTEVSMKTYTGLVATGEPCHIAT